MKKWILIIVAVVFVAVIGLKIRAKIVQDQALKAQATQQKGQSRSSIPMVRVKELKPQPIHQTMKVIGNIAAADELSVQPRTSGRLISLLVDEGTAVKKGQLVAIIDDESIRIQMQQTEASLSGTRANVQQAELNAAKAKTDRDRYQELLKQRYISQRDFENMENAYQTAQASLDALKAQLHAAERNYDLLKLQLNQTKIYSPINGVVTHKLVTEGMNLTTGSTIFNVADLNPVKLTFNVDQKDAPALRKGASVSFTTDAYGAERFEGKINEVAPTYDTKTRTLNLSVPIVNPARKLLPGMFGTAEVTLGAKQDAMVVPVEAVVTQQEQSGVYVVVKNIASFRPVQIGLRNEGEVEIVSGVGVGDQVVVLGQNRLRDGQQVQLMARGEQGERGRNGNKGQISANNQGQRGPDGAAAPERRSRKAGGGQ